MTSPSFRSAATRLVVAAALVSIIYPAVVWFGGSLAPSNLRGAVVPSSRGEPVSATWPGFELPSPAFQFADLGAAAWQFEPSYRRLALDLRQGGISSWDPSVAAGLPRASVLVDAQLSPLSWAAALPGGGPTAFTYAVIAMVVVGCWALMQVLEEHVGTGRAAAVAAGGVFVASGFGAGYVNSQVGQPYFLAPLLLWALVADDRARRPVTFALVALATAAIAMSAFAPVILLVGTTVHILASCIRGEVSGRLVLRRGAGILCGALLAAPLLLPAIDYLLLAGGGGQVAGRSAEPRAIASLLGLLTPAHVWHTLDPRTHPAGLEIGWTAWLGTATVIVATVGRWRRGWSALAPRLVVLVTGLVHTQIYPAFVGDSAILGVVRPVYWASAMALAAAFVVGTSLDDVARHASVRRVAIAAGLVLAVGAVVVAVVGLPPRVPAGFLGVNLVVMAAVMVAVAGRSVHSIPLTSALLSVVVVSELVFHAPHRFPPRVDVVAEPGGAVAWLQQRGPDARFVNAGRSNVHPDWAAPLGLQQFGTLSFPQLPWFREVHLSAMGGHPGGLFLVTAEPSAARPFGTGVEQAGLDRAAVRYLLVDGGAELTGPWSTWQEVYEDRTNGDRILENPDVYPRAYLAAQAIRPGSLDPGAQDRTVVSSEDDDFLGRVSHLRGRQPAGSASFVSYGPERVEVDVSVDREAILVLLDTWHPRWKVRVADTSGHVARVNGAFRGVAVPAGRSRVTFTYDDRLFDWGLLVSAVTAVALGATVARSGAGRLRRRGSGG